jgi:hydroxysqualene dehydroxylase
VGHSVATQVAIVGAGYAGMAAAVTLAERGVVVTVFESGPIPGGRARRVVSQGRELDNGQHIFVGAYTELLRLVRLVGVPADALLRLPLEIRYANGFVFRGLLRARGVPFRERVRALAFMAAMRRNGWRIEPDITVRELLDRFRQRGAMRRYVWAPLCVSALNTPLHQASANVFLAVLRDTLGGSVRASDLILPRIDLSRLFPEPAADFVRARGGQVLCGQTVRELAALKDFSGIIVAVGPHQLKTLVPEIGVEYTYQPIYTCYLQYPQFTRLGHPMVGLAEGLVQWVFDRGALLGEKGCLVCVISAQGEHQNLGQEELASACDRELRHAFPGLPDPLWSRVIAEKRATISCTPGLKKPNANGVVLAGDYTDPEYPPTVEAAVRSGIRAARALI